MNKDAILATIIGFGVGLAIAGLVFFGPSLFKNFPSLKLPDFGKMFAKMSAVKPAAKPASKTKPSDKLTIESPLPEAIETDNESLISGNAPPNAIVVITGETTDTVAVANADGAFAGKIGLGEGKNDITVTSYDKGVTQTASVTVYYTPEDF